MGVVELQHAPHGRLQQRSGGRAGSLRVSKNRRAHAVVVDEGRAGQLCDEFGVQAAEHGAGNVQHPKFRLVKHVKRHIVPGELTCPACQLLADRGVCGFGHLGHLLSGGYSRGRSVA